MESILLAIDTPTKQCRRLATIIESGVAFHHSGLVSKQRELVENSFREGKIKVIVATPTLCLSADTAVWHGISDTVVSRFNCSHKLFVLSKNHLDGIKALKVQKIMNTEKLINISTVSGYSIKLTPHHNILVKRNHEKKLINASECTKKDKIATIGVIHLKKNRNCKFSDFVKIYSLPFNDTVLNKNDFYVIGAMMGDGYSGAEHRNHKLLLKGSPCIVGKDNEVFDQVKSFVKHIIFDIRIDSCQVNVTD